jgi:transcriptional regulator with XRE-family HTH domain
VYPPETVDAAVALKARGVPQVAIAQMLGTSEAAVSRWVRGKSRRANRERVPVDRLRDAFLVSDRSTSDVARGMGWFKGNGKANEGSVTAALGLRAVPTRKGCRYVRKTVDIDTAERLAKAIGVDPWEVGL